MTLGDRLVDDLEVEIDGVLLTENPANRGDGDPAVALQVLDFRSGADVVVNDQTMPFGVLAGFDGAGGRPMTATYSVDQTEGDPTGLDGLTQVCALFKEGPGKGIAWREGGKVWAAFGRSRRAYPDTSQVPFYWVQCRFEATSAVIYGPELGPFTLSHGTPLSVAADDGNCPTDQWSMVVGPCVDPSIIYTVSTPGGTTTQTLFVGFGGSYTVATGHTLTIAGWYDGIPRCFDTNSSGVSTPVQVWDTANGRPAKILPFSEQARTVTFNRVSGASTASLYLRNGFT